MNLGVKATVVVMCLASLTTSATAQGPEKSTSKTAAAQPATRPVQPAAAASDVWEQLIYVPYRNLKSVFEKHPSTVFLPYLEYLKLWERAGGAARTAQGPPVPGVITQAGYVATVDENLARITVKLKIQVLGTKWSEIPVSFGQAAIGKISSTSGKEASGVLLRGTGAGKYALLFPEPGTHEVTLELTTRIRTSADGHSFELDCPTVGMTTFELSIPRPAQAVDLTPRLVALPIEAAEGQTRIRARLGATPKIAALWYPRVGQKPDMDLLSSVNNYQHVSIRDGLVHTDAHLHHEVLRGELNQLRIAVPVGHRILDIASTQAKIKSWKAVAEKNRQVVTVEFIGAVRGKFILEVHTERPAPAVGQVFPVSGVDVAGIAKSTIDDAGMKIHGIHSLDAVRESGQVVLTHGPDLTLNVAPPRGLVRIEPAEVLQTIRRPGGRSYKYYSPRFDLGVSYEPVQPRITVDQVSRLIFRDDELRLTSQLKYTVERAGVFEWKLRLPAGLELDDVKGDGYKEHGFDKASRILTVSLAQRRQGAVGLRITAHQPFDGEADTVNVALPVIEPLGVIRENGSVAVYAPNAYEIVTDEGKLSGVQPDRSSRQAAAVGFARLASAWQYTSYPTTDVARKLSLPVTTRRRPTRLSATVATSATARQQLVELESHVVFLVEYAGKDTFRIQVPEAVGDQAQITVMTADRRRPVTVPIREKTAGDAVDGWVTWTIVMQRERTGPVAFRVVWDLKSAESKGGAGGSREVLLQPPRPLDLDNDNIIGEIVIRKDRSLEVRTSEPGQPEEGLERIDVRELQLIPSTGSAAFRYHHRKPVGLQIITQQFEAEQVVETVVSRGLVEVVINKEGRAGVRCRYRLKSSERQRLRVDLPRGSRTPDVFVGRRQVPAELFEGEKNEDEDWKSYSINVSGTKTDEEFTLTLRYDLDLDSFFGSWFGGTESIALPQIGGVASGDGVDVVTQELKVAVWVPEEYGLVGAPEKFVILSTNSGQLERWFDRQGRGGDPGHFPTQGREFIYGNLGGSESVEVTWWKNWSMTAGISIPIFAIGCVLLWTPWTNRAGVVLVVSFIVSLWSRKDIDGVTEALLAARWGIGFVIAVWLLAAVVGFQRTSLFSLPWSKSTEPGEDLPPDSTDQPPATDEDVSTDTVSGDEPDADGPGADEPEDAS